jgi:hypothetical protein
MPTLQQEQQPIDEAITRSVLQSIPADWTAAVLTLERRSESSGVGDFSHSLASGDGRRPVMPDDSLYDATFRLDEVFRRHGAFLTRVTYRVEQRAGGEWSYSADYQHEHTTA